MSTLKSFPLILLLFFLTSCPKNASTLTGATIEKGKVGPLTIGMQKEEVTKFLSAFEMEETDAFYFGFDGGSKALLYSFRKKPVVALIPFAESDKIKAIVVLNSKTATNTGICPGMSASTLLEAYPNSQFHHNELSGWEEVNDTANQWTFVFLKDRTELNNPDNLKKEPYTPQNTSAKIDYIIVQ